MSQTKPPMLAQAQTTQPPTSPASQAPVTPPPATPQSAAAATTSGTGTPTYLPFPLPVQPAPNASPLAVIFYLGLILLLAFVARTLWRLPETLSDREWVQRMGGPYAVQNRALHVLGYITFVIGLLTSGFTTGIMVAALLMIAANTRPQGEAQREL